MRTLVILLAVSLLAGAVAAPTAAAAEPGPTCVRAPCGGPAEQVEHYREVVECTVRQATGKHC